MPFAQSGNVRIYYETQGSGPAIAFVHGTGGNHASWWQQVSYFCKAYRVITVDLRGFGKSETVPAGPDCLDFPRDLGAALDHAGVERVTLVGQSLGGVVALRFAVSHPERVDAVVLANSLGGMSHPELTPLVAADRAEAEKLPVLDRLLTRAFQTSQIAKTFLFQQLGTFNLAARHELRNLNTAGPTLDEIVRLGLRVYILSGERDAVVRPATIRAAHSRIPGSVLTSVPDAPHSLYWELPELFNASVHQFLQQIYGASQSST